MGSLVGIDAQEPFRNFFATSRMIRDRWGPACRILRCGLVSWSAQMTDRCGCAAGCDPLPTSTISIISRQEMCQVNKVGIWFFIPAGGTLANYWCLVPVPSAGHLLFSPSCLAIATHQITDAIIISSVMKITYPLVNIQKTIENGHRHAWFSH